VVDRLQAAIGEHLRESLGLHTDAEYRFRQPPAIPGLGQTWPKIEWLWGDRFWGDDNSPFRDWTYCESLSEAMSRAPEMWLFVATGKYDLSITIGAAAHALAQSTWPPERTRSRSYEGGHAMYAAESTLAELSGDLRRLIVEGIA
jgi:hypothetical protein